MNTTVKQIKAWKRRARIAKFRLKWLKGNCRHFCRWCEYKEICDIYNVG